MTHHTDAGHKDISDMLHTTEGGDPSTAAEIYLAKLDAKRKELDDITIKTSNGNYVAKFLVWAGGEFQYPRSIPNTVRKV